MSEFKSAEIYGSQFIKVKIINVATQYTTIQSLFFYVNKKIALLFESC